jgi:hypothetical protein
MYPLRKFSKRHKITQQANDYGSIHNLSLSRSSFTMCLAGMARDAIVGDSPQSPSAWLAPSAACLFTYVNHSGFLIHS